LLFNVPLSSLVSNQFIEEMRELAALEPLLPVALLDPSTDVPTRWRGAGT